MAVCVRRFACYMQEHIENNSPVEAGPIGIPLKLDPLTRGDRKVIEIDIGKTHTGNSKDGSASDIHHVQYLSCERVNSATFARSQIKSVPQGERQDQVCEMKLLN